MTDEQFKALLDDVRTVIREEVTQAVRQEMKRTAEIEHWSVDDEDMEDEDDPSAIIHCNIDLRVADAIVAHIKREMADMLSHVTGLEHASEMGFYPQPPTYPDMITAAIGEAFNEHIRKLKTERLITQ